jgi:hypothetical protein
MQLILSQLNQLLPISSSFKISFNIILLPRSIILISGFQIKVLCEFLKLICYDCVLQNVELMLLFPPPKKELCPYEWFECGIFQLLWYTNNK